MFIIACVHEGFMYFRVFALNNTIGLGVIWGNLDMMDVIFLGQISSHCYKCGAIVSNNFHYSTPLTENILEYKVSESLLVFFPKRVPLGPRIQGTMGLNKIAKLIDSWHEHGVNMNLAEKCRNVG